MKGEGDDMIKLPEGTRIHKSIPKEILYKYVNVSGALTRSFVDEIVSIIWLNNLSPETMRVQAGKKITEIAVIEIVLKRQANSQKLLEILNREIDQYAIFIIRYEEWGHLCCGCKESGKKAGEAIVDCYCQTSWMPYDDLKLDIQGPDLDQVYKNVIMQITGVPVPFEDELWVMKNEAGEADTHKNEMTEKLERLTATVAMIEKQLDQETNFNRQLKLMSDLINIKADIQTIQSSRTNMMVNAQSGSEGLPLDNIERLQALFPNVVMKFDEN
jgi:hypothetical protein